MKMATVTSQDRFQVTILRIANVQFAEWVLQQCCRGHPPSRVLLQALAHKVLELGGAGCRGSWRLIEYYGREKGHPVSGLACLLVWKSTNNQLEKCQAEAPYVTRVPIVSVSSLWRVDALRR